MIAFIKQDNECVVGNHSYVINCITWQDLAEEIKDHVSKRPDLQIGFFNENTDEIENDHLVFKQVSRDKWEAVLNLEMLFDSVGKENCLDCGDYIVWFDEVKNL